MSVLEKQVLASLLKACKRRKIMTVRMAFRPGVSVGFPDVALLPGNGRVVFVECKRPGGTTSAIQDVVISDLRKAGYDVVVFDGAEPGAADALLDALALL